MNSIFIRKRQAVIDSSVPDRYQNFSSECDEEGNFKLTPCDPVAPSLAEDFSVSILALQGRTNSSVNSRINVDPCDIPDKLSKF